MKTSFLPVITKSGDPEFDWVVEVAGGVGELGGGELGGRELGGLGVGLQEVASGVVEEVQGLGGGKIQLWVLGVGVGDDERLRPSGFVPYRDLWKLEVALPAELPDGYVRLEERGDLEGSDLDKDDLDGGNLDGVYRVRAYESGDEKEFLEVNRRAFAWHPEQGRLDSDGLQERFSEDWYDPQGFLILEATDTDRIAGFCWTKVHRSEPDVSPNRQEDNTPDSSEPVGEIYAIGVDPDFAGQGLGLPLTHAGLEYLHLHQGINQAMLYVESDNSPANKIYKRLGFQLAQVNRAYECSLPS